MMSESEKSNLDLFLERYTEVTESQEFEYNSSDWSALAERMDRDEYNKRMITIIMIIGIISTFLISWNLAPATTIATNKNKSAVFDQNESLNINERLDQKSEVVANEVGSTKNVETEYVIQQANSPRKINSAAFPEDKRSQAVITKLNTEVESENIANEQKLTDKILENNTPGHRIKLNSSPDDKLKDKEVSENISPGSDVVAVRKDSGVGNLKIKNGLKVESLQSIASLGYESQVFTIEDRVKLPELVVTEVYANRTPTRFVFGIQGGVEVSQTPLGNLSDTDFSIGAKFGIVASDNFVLNVGVSYIRECYVAPTSDYTVPLGFWQGNVPDDIQAVCDMLDFSIGASYYFNDILNNGLVGHVNFSSNSMLKETYEYQFADSGTNWEEEFSFANSTLLSNIELGSTYNFMIGNKYSMDLGPYIKIPINGIGNGDVKLRSFGFRMGINAFR